mmetsp:Transcript_3772/g.7906  ORF Transcript_3772/g.7906 Transcript_3772/m.7906 type:complete len:94 (-) Transcript_3772:659-940(-)
MPPPTPRRLLLKPTAFTTISTHSKITNQYIGAGFLVAHFSFVNLVYNEIQPCVKKIKCNKDTHLKSRQHPTPNTKIITQHCHRNIIPSQSNQK